MPALAITKRISQRLYRLANDAVRFAFGHFEWPHLIDELVDDISKIEGVEHAHAEVDGEFQAGFAACGLDAVGLLKQQDAEAIETCVLKGKAIFGFIHPEAAWSAGTCGEEDVVVDNLLARLALLFEHLEIADEIAHREVSRVTLAVVPKLLPCLEVIDYRSRDVLATVTAAVKDRLDHFFVFPCQAAEGIVT